MASSFTQVTELSGLRVQLNTLVFLKLHSIVRFGLSWLTKNSSGLLGFVAVRFVGQTEATLQYDPTL